MARANSHAAGAPTESAPAAVKPAQSVDATPPTRTRADVQADIRALREAFIGHHAHRRELLENALDEKRADVVADQILVLEAELNALASPTGK